MVHMDKQHAITQKKGSHATYSQVGYEIYHLYQYTNYDNQMKNDTNIMLEDDQENIQYRESIWEVKWYTMVSPYMGRDHNKHVKIRVAIPSKTRWAINTINMSISQTNIAMKHKRNSYLEILNQDKMIIIINTKWSS